MNYPGFDLLKKPQEAYFRSVGIQESGSQLGFGFMDKTGVREDEKNTLFPYYSACYVIRGHGVYIDRDGKKYNLSPGSLFQRFPDVPHSTYIDPSSRWAECYIDFGTNIYRNFLINMKIIDTDKPVVQLKEDPAIEERIWFMLKELEHSAEQKLPDLMIKSLELLRSLLGKGIDSVRDNRSLSIVEKSCRDFTRDYRKRIDLRQYCRERAVGYESFRKSFRRVTGLSPGKYIIRRRIDMACHLLFMSDKSIKEIAEDLGYKSQYEFSSQFKELTGLSPRNYRNGNPGIGDSV